MRLTPHISVTTKHGHLATVSLALCTHWLINNMYPPLSLSLIERLRTAHCVLCPVSGIGTAYAVNKHVTIIGTGIIYEIMIT